VSTTPPVPPKVKQQQKQQSIKQQRAAERARKLEEHRRREARATRNRRIGIGAAIVGAVAIVALIVTTVVLTPQPPSYAAGGEGVEIDGVETFENESTHVEGVVDYEQTPPAGENAEHSLEHGAVWVTYDSGLSDDDVATLRSKLPSTYVILSPFEDLPSPVVLSAWNTQLQLDDVEDERIPAFLEEYWQHQSVPEPGAPCTGAFDAPGKVS
jgi:hypothetical protein